MWIDVNERKPEKMCEVLVVNINFTEVLIHECRYVPHLDVFIYDPLTLKISVLITHWMPLPRDVVPKKKVATCG